MFDMKEYNRKLEDILLKIVETIPLDGGYSI
jgi:hypothetical protein